MTHLTHPAWIEVDLKQFTKNIQIIKKYVAPRLFCLSIKANAYGHGLVPMAKAAEAAGVDYLGVAFLQEGIHLRQANIKIPILVFGALHESQITDFIKHDLEFTLSSSYKAQLTAKVCEAEHKKCRVHLEVDTGMNRTGMRPETALKILDELRGHKYIEVVGVTSHFATADAPGDLGALAQIKLFNEFLEKIRLKGYDLLAHISGSGGITHYLGDIHGEGMVRPGLLAFGYPQAKDQKVLDGIEPCFALSTKVSYFKVIPKGSGVSYGHTFVAKEQTRIATIPVGYGDGYRRALSNRGSVVIRGKKFPIAGTVCMDQFMVDLGPNGEAYVGDQVTLIGKQEGQEITLLDLAELCGTIPYELLCQFTDRIPRIYTT